MNENINLCKLLKGHEGETFYSSAFGDVVFVEINTKNITYPIKIRVIGRSLYLLLTENGKWYYSAECVLFPSKNQRDWNKWAEEQKPKGPKTWSELVKANLLKRNMAAVGYVSMTGKDAPIEKAALALLKIHQLIEVGYGGNITDKEWKNIHVIKYVVTYEYRNFEKYEISGQREHIAFHTPEQREEFLSYPENVQLIKDFYMI